MKPKGKLLLTTAIAALSLAAILGSCKKDDFVQVDAVCPLEYQQTLQMLPRW